MNAATAHWLRLLQLVLCACWAPALAARAESIWIARQWTVAEGLPQGTINDILVSPDGALWIATNGGAARFDGATVRSLDSERLDLPTNRVAALAAGPAGEVWIVLQTGVLARIDARGDLVERIEGPEPGVEITDATFDRLGRLWLRSVRTLQVREDGAWKRMSAPAEHQGRSTLLALDDGGLLCLDGEAAVEYGPDGQVAARALLPLTGQCLFALDDGSPAIGCNGGVLVWNHGNPRELEVEGLDDLSVLCAIPHEDDEIWLGTERGPIEARVLDGGRLRVSPPVTALGPGFAPRCFAIDGEGNVWVGAEGRGLARLRERRVEQLDAWMRPVLSLARLPDGRIAAAGRCSGLRYHSDTEARTDELLQGRGEVCVQSQLVDAGRRHWIGLRDKLLCDDGAGVRELGAAPLGIYDCLADAGDGVWAGLRGGTVVRLGFDGGVAARAELGEGRICSLLSQPDGAVLVGMESALWRMERDGATRRVAGDQPHLRGELRAMQMRPDGSLWLASYGSGLLRLKGGVVHGIGVEQGLHDASLSGFVVDERERVWLLSNRGLMVLPVQEIEAAFDGRAQRVVPVVLGLEAGAPEGNRGQPAALLDERGRAWFGTVDGILRVDTRAFPYQSRPPAAIVDEVRIGDRHYAAVDGLVLPPAPDRVRFDYTAFSLTAPERVVFATRLVGHDDEWREAVDVRSVEYTGLAPRSYTFELRARNEDGVWSGVTRWSFELLPHWWQTWWFRLSAASAAALALFGLHRLRLSIVQRTADRLVAAERARTRAEEDASRLRADLAHVSRLSTAGEMASSLAHEVNQPLGAISANAEAAQHMLAAGHSAELGEVLADIASQSRRASEVVRRLRTFLQKKAHERVRVDLTQVARDALQLVRFELRDAKVEAFVRVDGPLPQVLADTVQLQQVCVNLYKNACEACSGRPRGGRLEIELRKEGSRLVMEVHDDGPGMPPEVRGRLFEPYTSTKPEGMGLGLAICRSIIEAHGGRLASVPARLGGASFRLELPIIQ